MKVAVVVGQNSKASGAFSPFLNVSEFRFNSRVAQHMKKSASEYNIQVEIIFQEASSGFSEEIRKAYRKVNRKQRDLVVELNFNALSPQANGSEMLYWHRSEKGKILARSIQSEVVGIMHFANPAGCHQTAPNCPCIFHPFRSRTKPN